MATTSSVLTRLNARLMPPTPETETVSESSLLQSALSGAFGRQIRVKEWVSGGLRALVPADELVTSGLTIAESVICGDAPILTGNAVAVSNAERRIAKRAGEGWSATLEAFVPERRLVVFEMHRAAPAAHP